MQKKDKHKNEYLEYIFKYITQDDADSIVLFDDDERKKIKSFAEKRFSSFRTPSDYYKKNIEFYREKARLNYWKNKK